MEGMEKADFKGWILPVVCIWITTFLVGTITLYLPGVYFDAVYPDYLAAIGAFPGGGGQFYTNYKTCGFAIAGEFLSWNNDRRFSIYYIKVCWTCQPVDITYS